MPQVIEQSIATVPQHLLTSVLIRRLRVASSQRSDPVRFQLMVLLQIDTIFVQKRSAVQIKSVADRIEMEDSSAVVDLLSDITREFDRRNLPEKEQMAILMKLHDNIKEYMFPKLLI